MTAPTTSEAASQALREHYRAFASQIQRTANGITRAAQALSDDEPDTAIAEATIAIARLLYLRETRSLNVEYPQ